MVQLRYFIVLIFIQQSLLFVDSISINTNILHPLSRSEVVQEQVLQPRYPLSRSEIVEEQVLVPSSSVNKQSNAGLLQPRSADGLCPAKEDISPCACDVSEDNALTMICSDISTEDELQWVFSSYFPEKQFDMFITYDCPLRVLENGVFGDVTFAKINMKYGSLQEVEHGALAGMTDTLVELHLDDNHIEYFPFETIESFTKLKLFSLDNNWEHMTTFPVIKSESLNTLYLAHGKYDIPVDAFQGLPMIEEIYIYSDQIISIESETFRNLSHLRVVDLSGNLLEEIPEELFHFTDGLNNLETINLARNHIEKIEEKAFDAIAGVSIQLFGNNLPTIDEAVWTPLFDVGIDLDIANNPLLCGCDIAWIVQNPDYLGQIKNDAKCADGEYLHQLDPHIFDDC